MLFDPWQIGGARAPNRLWRAATYEGLAGAEGFPAPELADLYMQIATGGAGAIITGFCYVSRAGRAMQPRQCGIDTDEKIPAWRRVVASVRARGRGTLLFMQIAHAGRQTLAAATGGQVLAPTAKVSPYFRSRPRFMNEDEVRAAIGEFVAAAGRAQRAGFDGVELHAAHGYLIHQFLSPFINDRRDAWGADRLAFLREIVTGIRAACGPDFPVLVKVSAGDFHPGGVDAHLAAQYAARLADLGVDAIEVSCGTMDLAMNIFRGGLPVQQAFDHNPLFRGRPAWQKALWRRFGLPRLRRRLVPFAEAYNRAAARVIRERTPVPLILVGGIRSRAAMDEILATRDADVIALCRPLVREPGLPDRLRGDPTGRSACVNCNLCAVMCDSANGLRCYQQRDSATGSRREEKENRHEDAD